MQEIVTRFFLSQQVRWDLILRVSREINDMLNFEVQFAAFDAENNVVFKKNKKKHRFFDNFNWCAPLITALD